ncbi:ethanolamine utilization protein EutH [Evansella sp. AB-P1]|uniref:ethanolamine utilization protein EutH n=1 Tax=Evansella sp. AB-P1 TaxID=3037653 RepID=UPI00241D3941|nr:ethanolamine utilization protein EutH [Evansella sp. AB-P1]MDG5786295.1 ethanolamine utilization protein EutH [Evansella sp. AB-P1]
MWVNEVVIWILVVFMCIGVIDRVCGNKKGYGKAFEEGFMSMGPIALAMVGIISISPVLANGLRPIITPIFSVLGADPAMFPGIILAIDMGGYSLAMELAQTEMAGQFSGIIVATLIGPTFVFTIPVALSLIEKEDEAIFSKGILIGLIPIPIGAFFAGYIGNFPISFILVQLIPLFLFSAIIATGLLVFPQKMITCFSYVGKFVVGLITVALGVSIIETLTGFVIIPGMTPLSEGIYIVGIIAITLAGAFPAVHFLKRALASVLPPLAKKMKVSEIAFIGLLSSLAHSIPMFKLLSKMDEKGKLMNISFAVSGAFVLGGHLGFTASVEQDLILPMMTGKLVAGVLSVMLAFYIGSRRASRNYSSKGLID